jgi:protein gp37
MANRLRGAGVKSYENGFDLTLNPDVLDDPKKVKRPSMFFVCSMGDLFHKDVPFKFVDRVMETIELTPRHRYQLLTKRANLMHQYFVLKGYVPDNVWVGVTVEDERAKERMWFLKDIKET